MLTHANFANFGLQSDVVTSALYTRRVSLQCILG